VEKSESAKTTATRQPKERRPIVDPRRDVPADSICRLFLRDRARRIAPARSRLIRGLNPTDLFIGNLKEKLRPKLGVAEMF
jgi:hypothetical protein